MARSTTLVLTPLLCSFVALAACVARPSPDDSDTTESTEQGHTATVSEPAATVPLYSQVKPIIQRDCARCHHGEFIGGTFETLDKIKAKRARMIAKIGAGLMPRGNPTWKATPDGEMVLAFLKESPELE